jgi:hypothetical protein
LRRPPPVDSRILDIGFNNTGFLTFFDGATSVVRDGNEDFPIEEWLPIPVPVSVNAHRGAF